MSPDEEVGSLAERGLITALGAEHEVVLVAAKAPGQDESIRLATSGIELAVLGREGSRCACRKCAGSGTKRVLRAGTSAAAAARPVGSFESGEIELDAGRRAAASSTPFRPMPGPSPTCGPTTSATSKAVEATIRERIKNHLIPDTTVDVRFEHIFPPMPFRSQSLPLAEHAQRVYAESRWNREDQSWYRSVEVPTRPSLRSTPRRPCSKGFGSAKFRLALERRGVRQHLVDRAPPLSPDAHDHGRLRRQDRGRQVVRS